MSSALWINGRARNALRRPLRVGAVGLGVFVVALLGLVTLPRRVQQAAQVVAPDPGERRDTIPLMAAILRGRQRLALAEQALGAARERLARPVQSPAIDTLPPAVVARRDSLARIAGELARLVARVEQAPLAASYRALAEAPPMGTDEQVRALVDSLAVVEREREGFDAVGGIDPNYVALTARATEIGRAIQEIAERRVSTIRGEVAALTPPAPPRVTAPVIDTTALAARRDSVQSVLHARVRLLQDAHRVNASFDARAARARDLANVSAPPWALLAAALVLGAAAGFGATLLGEMRAPRVADAREAEWAGAVRVLARVTTYEPPPERVRRKSDRDVPPLLESASDAYRFLYLHLASTAPGTLGVTIAARDPALAAVVGANIAALAALEARLALLVDADPQGVLASVVRVRPTPGLADIAAGEAAWSEAAVAQTTGRDRTIDVVTAGARTTSPADIAALLARDLPRLVRRYDAVVVSSGLEPLLAAPLLPLPRIVVCARTGVTPLDELAGDVDALHDAGAHVVGIVLWDRDEPSVPSRAEHAALYASHEGVDPELILTPAGRPGR